MDELEQNIVRPNPLQWLRYTLVGSVPAKNRAWVLYDATCRTWLLRHAVRYLVLVSPLILGIMLFLPASVELRAEACFAAGASMLIGYMCFTTESLEHRIEKAGYRYGLAGKLREQRAIDAQRAVTARNRERREARLYR